MSQFFAEAEVLIRPNTTGFVAELEAQVKTAIAGVQATLPPVVVPAVIEPVTAGTTAGLATVGAQLEGASSQMVLFARESNIATGQLAAFDGAAAGAALSLGSLTQMDRAAAQGLMVLGAATERAAVATGLLATAEADLAFVAEAGSLATEGLGVAQAKLAAAGTAVATSTAAFDAALAAGSAELEIATLETLSLAAAETTVAEAATVEARALVESTAAATAAARAHAQLARGAEATGLSLFGIRGATLAASSSFLAGAAAVTIAAKSIGAASDRVEQLNKSVEVFAGSAPQVQRWSETTAAAMGISQTAALAASSTYGQLFRTLGTGPEEAAKLSENLVQLASDLASFNNVSVDRALQAIQSGLVGQARPLRALGIFLTEARVKQEALTQSGKASASALTQQDKILARYNLILKDSVLAQGDFQRTQDRLANQGRILSAQMNDLAASIGQRLTPALTRVVVDINSAIDAFTRLGQVKVTIPVSFPIVGGKSGQSIGSFLADSLKQGLLNIPVAGQGLQLLIGLDRLLNKYNQTQKAAKAATDGTAGAFNRLTLTTAQLRAEYERLANVDMAAALKRASHQADVLTQQQEQIQAGVLPGGRAAEEANIRAQIAAQQATIDTAKVGSKAYRDALREKKRLRDELKSLTDQDASDAQAAASAIQQARDKADQAIQDAITTKTTRVDTAKTLAEGTKSTLDDLKALRFERRTILTVIHDLIPLIKDEATRRALYQQYNLALIQTNNAIRDLIKTRKEGNAARRQAAIDAQQQHLETLISIAQTTPGTADDLRTLNAYRDFLEKRIAALKKIQKKTLEEKAQLDAYRLALAQTNQSIRELSKESQKGSTFAQQAFAFLQTQQGFVSNLLGNLIPGGLTGGLVGGQPSVPSNAPRQVAGGFEQPRGVNFTAGEAVRTRPPSAQQSERQIDWLRKIYAALVDLKRGNEHPEAKTQRAKGAAAYDYGYQGPGM